MSLAARRQAALDALSNRPPASTPHGGPLETPPSGRLPTDPRAAAAYLTWEPDDAGTVDRVEG